MKRHILAAALVCAVTTGPAAAYTSYLLPEQFFTTEAEISAQGSFAQQFFTPTIATGGSTFIISPSGSRSTPDRLEIQPTIMRMTTDLPRGGTYRLSTGEQVGPVSTLVGENGTWRPLAQDEVPAVDAPTTTLQAVTLAEAYVTRGTPSRTAIDENPVGRLALRPVTHPNQVLAAQGMEVEVLFDGAPLPNLAVVLYTAGEADTQVDRYSVTDAQGRVRFAFTGPGQFLIAARHRAAAPEGSGAAVRSYTTTLTIEALATLPRNVEINDPAAPRRPRPMVGRR